MKNRSVDRRFHGRRTSLAEDVDAERAVNAPHEVRKRRKPYGLMPEPILKSLTWTGALN